MWSPSTACFLAAFLAICASAQTVTLDYATFSGKASDTVVQFLGMPYAAAPTGNLRFAPPQAPSKSSGTRQATTYGAGCLPLPGGFGGGGKSSEDCLFINVVKPQNIASGKTLPVLVWIYGGAFQIGDSAQNPGDTVVKRSVAVGEPIVFVSFNYRLNGFGFMGGSEIKNAGITNAGIRDQTFALEWVQKYIANFGGDPTKVIIWGESAGAVSVALHLVLNDGDPQGLFRGAFMESGSPLFLPTIEFHQNHFDNVVKKTNCASAADKIQCLRGVSASSLQSAIAAEAGNSLQLSLAFHPTTDGEIFLRDPWVSVQQGKYVKVPIVTGDCEDEGTLFAQDNSNVTTNAQFLSFMKTKYFPDISDANLTTLGQVYPDDPRAGSPFNTGTNNALTPQYKRIAAFLGDYVFQNPRRFFSEYAAKTQNVWGFRYMKGGSGSMGVNHAADIPFFFNTASNTNNFGVDSLIYFAAYLNPIPPSSSSSALKGFTWPLYSTSTTAPPLLTFIDASPGINITTDTYRIEAFKFVQTLVLGQLGHGV